MKCVEGRAEGGAIQLSPLALPDTIVEGSARSWAYVSGDIFASSLQNIGNLVRMPTGCGEQNMVKLAPNIYLLQYLSTNPQPNTELQQKAKRFMQIGYSRQEKYRHPGGAYSIWGGEDVKAGSTWLTAFVVKVFAQASEFIEVDAGRLEESVAWLVGSQLENGCFEKRGYVYSSSLQGGNSDDSLSAFVLAALVEANSKFDFKKKPTINLSIRQAISCVQNRRNESDLYAMSLSSYALSLYKTKMSEASASPIDIDVLAGLDENLDFLLEASNSSLPGARFWDQTTDVGDNYWWSYSRSTAVEMTAYNVMSFVLNKRATDVIDAVKWMARQRNSQGGFVSTQDTVVALQALSVYGNEFAKYKTNMEVKATLDSLALATVNLNEDNKVLQQYIRNDDGALNGSYSFNLAGSGCVLVQSVLRYNVPEAETKPSFDLKAASKEGVLNVCFAYTGPRDSTDMVMLEVELVSGYSTVHPDSLINEIDSGVQRVEEDEKENLVVLYFDAHDKGEERCINLEMRQTFKIEELKPARVSVYDYYSPSQKHEITYTI